MILSMKSKFTEEETEEEMEEGWNEIVDEEMDEGSCGTHEGEMEMEDGNG